MFTCSPAKIRSRGRGTAIWNAPSSSWAGSTPAAAYDRRRGLVGDGGGRRARRARRAGVARAARTDLEDRNGAAAGAAQERGNRQCRTRAGPVAGARTIAGGVRRTRTRQPAKQQRSILAAGA